ncbi:MAG: hypothetical protein HIU93_12960 [Acidobacteria bacterium]|nr:hypothetical protein [Acidobacteriota bacterium]
MQSALVIQPPERPVRLRDIASLMFRHKRLFTASFFTVLLAAFSVAILLPPKYESSVKLLVERERVDTPISPERSEAYQAPSEEITEAKMNSELELLRTDDVLRGVVLQTGLAGPHPSSRQVDRAITRLKNTLHIDPINKSNIIGVTYRSTSPQMSAKVLNTLVGLYFDKDMQISRQTGEHLFFDREAERYRNQLKELEKKIAALNVVSPELARDKMVARVTDLKATAAETNAAIAETEKRIASLKELEIHTPERLVTETKTADNPQLLQSVKSTLLTLELNRDQLLAKYKPSYRPVQELDKRIADTRAEIANEESKPLRDEVINQNPAFQWIKTELAKAQADLAGLRARRNADSGIVLTENQDLRELNSSGMAEHDLLREAKAAEENYLLYSQKREEARISEELDEKKILNIVVVQGASIPAVPVHQRVKIALLGCLSATVLSLIIVLVADFIDPHFRTLDEVVTSLEIPLLAAIPRATELNRLEAEYLREVPTLHTGV